MFYQSHHAFAPATHQMSLTLAFHSQLASTYPAKSNLPDINLDRSQIPTRAVSLTVSPHCFNNESLRHPSSASTLSP